MNELLEFGGAFVDGLGVVLRAFEGFVAPFTGAWAWGFAIMLLTVAVRIILLPLTIKQVNSMRGMQKLQPEVKKLQKKYKVDKTLMKTNPDKYRAQRQRQQEAMMSLYKEHNVNPMGGCLPLLAQMPIFFALFRLLYTDRIPELDTSGFVGITSLAETPANAGIGAIVLVVLMALSTFYQQKQMMDNNPASADNPQQKILLYALPAMLLFISFQIPAGVLVYWVTTNLWTIGQQFIMFRNVSKSESTPPKAA